MRKKRNGARGAAYTHNHHSMGEQQRWPTSGTVRVMLRQLGWGTESKNGWAGQALSIPSSLQHILGVWQLQRRVAAPGNEQFLELRCWEVSQGTNPTVVKGASREHWAQTKASRTLHIECTPPYNLIQRRASQSPSFRPFPLIYTTTDGR